MSDWKRGLGAVGAAWGLLVLSLFPARLAVAMRVRGGTFFERSSRAVAGTLLDFSRASLWVALVLAVVVLLVAWRFRGRWLLVGPSLTVVPLALGLYVITVTEQEVKAERGAFSTLREMLDAAGEASFVEGAWGFARYHRIWLPGLVCLAGFLFVLAVQVRRAWRPAGALSVRGWSAGVLLGLFGGVLAGHAGVAAVSFGSSRLSPSGVGDPLSSLVETTIDWARGQPPRKPQEILATLSVRPADVQIGAQRLGWPARAAACGPYRRPLDWQKEGEPPAAPLLRALEQLSTAVFAEREDHVAVFLFSLEGFRGADLAGLNPHAPPQLTPFLSPAFRGVGPARTDAPSDLVLPGMKVFQGGVRTAQGLASMTCGLGTLPWNLSMIRDLEPQVPVRCVTDVLSAAGFEGSFFYGSDSNYDRMGPFLQAHGLSRVVNEDSFPATTPRGAWGGVTDFALFDAALDRVAKGSETADQFALVMSLSNHSPFTPPQDLPPEVPAAVDQALSTTPHRATPDDRKRLITYAYTDAALARFMEGLRRSPLGQRAVVVVLADHSTGNDYVWGDDSFEHETDEAKAGVPFAVLLPSELRVKNPAALAAAADAVKRELGQQVLSSNDVPSLLLALLSAHPALRALPESERWHTLGGQRTSPHFKAGEEANAALLGINGVDELFLLDAQGKRVGAYEDVVFLRTAGDAEGVTPHLIPAAATVLDLQRTPRCP